MTIFNQPSTVAVIGAGVSGAACAASLQRAGLQVTLFDKSRGAGGRMATRRVRWAVPQDGAQAGAAKPDPSDAPDAPDAPVEPSAEHAAELDHGAQHFNARHPRFRAAVARAQAAGVVATWRPRVHSGFSSLTERSGFVPLPNMPALCRHWARDVPLRTEHPVQRLHRSAAGWQLVLAGGASVGPFDQVMLALPAAQAAVLLAGHHDDWADALAAVPMEACWTLMAVTDEADWPWDAAEPTKGPLAWIVRNDRKPGRSAPPGVACWVAHASAAWSAEHLEADPENVAAALRSALAALLPAAPALRWHHASVHRWRYAMPTERVAGTDECWWDAALGLGVCGDFFGAGQIEAAWRSGDELADTVASGLEALNEEAESV